MSKPTRDESLTRKPIRAKLIFNTIAGQPQQSPHQLTELLTELQKQHIMPEVFIVQPDSRVESVVRRAIKDGTKLIVVAGGDGTVESVASAMVGAPVRLGIIPTGTHNNMALNLGIPSNIPEAVNLLRTGTPVKIDAGELTIGRARRWFVEVLTLGLWSDLISAAGENQHGDISKVGELFSTLVASSPFNVRLLLDGHEKVEAAAHVVLVANMPYIGPNVQVDPQVSFKDGLLDVFLFSDMSKLNLISYALRYIGGGSENGAIPHYRAKRLAIASTPPAAIMADGVTLGAGPLKVKLHRRALTIMAGSTRGRGPKRSEVAQLKQTI